MMVLAGYGVLCRKCLESREHQERGLWMRANRAGRSGCGKVRAVGSWVTRRQVESVRLRSKLSAECVATSGILQS